MNNSRKVTAFSLIEISMVLVILGALIGFVTEAKDFIYKSRLTAARSQTQNAPIFDIPDLAHWYETSLPDSLEPAYKISGDRIPDETRIRTWYDRNEKLYNRADLEQDNVNFQPQYFSKVFNKTIPALRFFGGDDRMLSNEAFIKGRDITFFSVAKRASYVRNSGVFSALAIGETFDNNNVKSFRGFHEIDGNKMNSFRNGWGAQVDHPGDNIAYIASGMYHDGDKLSMNVNGGTYTTITLGAVQQGEFDATRLSIACQWQNNANTAGCYNGYIAELIFYNRALTIEERKRIEKYLSLKYDIPVSIKVHGGWTDWTSTESCDLIEGRGEAAEHTGTFTIDIGADKIVKFIDFASYGLPNNYTINNSCHSGSSKTQVESRCLNKSYCSFSPNNGIFGDPCPNIVKRLQVVYRYRKIQITQTRSCSNPAPAFGGDDCVGESTRIYTCP